jgi:HSP20 family molecular chaperone IbpA
LSFIVFSAQARRRVFGSADHFAADRTLDRAGADPKRKFHHIERCYGNFRRNFTLPEDADSTKVTAEFRDGVLKVHLPTTTIAKSKATQVKVA